MTALRSFYGPSGRWPALVLAGIACLALAAQGPPAHAQEPPAPARQGWLGMEVVELRADRLRERPDQEGANRMVVIRRVFEGSPADRAGVRPGDLVVRIDDAPLGSSMLRERLGPGLRPGTAVVLTIRREGEERTLRIEAGERPAFLGGERGSVAAFPRPSFRRFRDADSARVMIERQLEERREAMERAARLPVLLGRNFIAGAAVTTLNPELARYFSVEAGVLITEILERSPAADAGLVPGDVVVAAEGRSVASVEELRAALAARGPSPGEPRELEVVRMGEILQLSLPR